MPAAQRTIIQGDRWPGSSHRRVRFAPAGEGTQVSFSLSAELGGIKKLIMSKSVQQAMDGEMASLDKAKALIEQK